MSLIFDLKEIQRALNLTSEQARKQQETFTMLVSNLVKMHQEYRVAKNYAVSDRVRSILNDAGVEVTQGTAGYEYKDIPPSLRGRQADDTWRLTEPRSSGEDQQA